MAASTGAALLALSETGTSVLPVAATLGEPNFTGTVNSLAPRGFSSAFVAAQNGIFHTWDVTLLWAPMSQAFPAGARLVSSVGEGVSEEVWVVTDAEVFRIAASKLTAIQLGGLPLPEQLLAQGPGLALFAAQGAVYQIDVTGGGATQLAGELGVIGVPSRTTDGTGWFPTEKGLLAIEASGEARIYTFAIEGLPPAHVSAVTTSGSNVLAVAGSALVRVKGDGAERVAAADAATTPSAALDVLGNAWLLEGGKVYRVAVGAPVAFADLVPFFEAHCMGCHGPGGSAPPRELTTHSYAAANADWILQRLKADGVTPMPPESIEILTPDDYAIVQRWVATGKNP